MTVRGQGQGQLAVKKQQSIQRCQSISTTMVQIGKSVTLWLNQVHT